jgi:hypothetical protein
MVGQDLAGAPTTSDIFVCTFNELGQAWSALWNDYQTFSGFSWADVASTSDGYLRLRVNGTSIAADWSSDGQCWLQIVATTLAWVPAEVGIVVNNFNTGYDVQNVVEFFRVVDGTSDFNQIYGRRIGVSGTTPAQVWDTTLYTTSFTAKANTKHRVDASSFAGTISLPLSPLNGDEVTLKNFSASTNSMTVSGNGNNVEDQATFSLGATATISGDGAAWTYSFDGTQWVLI